MTPKTITARPGPSFAERDTRLRPCGRIAGSSAKLTPEQRTKLMARLGPNAKLLGGDDDVVVDDDASGVEDWHETARSKRLASVEGAFAVAGRTHEGRLWLARDALGHRTLYYAVVRGQLVFASRILALLEAFDIPREIAPRSVAAFLSYAYVPNRETMVKGVYEVLPGEIVRFDPGRQHLDRRMFWELPAETAASANDEGLVTRLRAELEHTIGSILGDDEVVCASLSGGIDSSLVVAVARRLLPRERTLRTFSITFGAPHRDELEWSSMVAAHCATDHHIVELPADAVSAHLDDTIARMDKPNGDPLTVPNALLFREMAEHGRVALNGEGGDPCFGGPKNLPMLLAELYGDGYEEEGADGARNRTYLRAHLKCFDELQEILQPDAYRVARTPPLEADVAPWFDDPRWESLIGKLMAINVRFKGGHHILPKVDALGAPFGMLPRSPLFMRRMVELAFELPSTAKLRGSIEKWALKEAVADLLPRAILDRPKSGMLVPVEGWFSGPLLPLAKQRLLDGALGRTGLFQRELLEQLVSGKLRGLRPRRGVKIWLLVTLESHLRALGLA